jgi:phage baseplate assembly protein gpV
VQHRQSDFDILAEAAEFCGQYFTLRDDTVQLMTLRGTGETVELTWGVNLFEARIEVNAEAVCESVATTGWDPSRVEFHQGVARSPRVGRRVNVGVSSARVGASAQRTLADRSLADDRQAEQLAQGELDRRVAGQVTLWGAADGDARLRPGTTVAVRGVEPDLEGHYTLTSVTHSIDDDKGFISEFSTSPPAPRRPPRRAAVATWGVVTDIQDPASLGRVRVRLPTYGDIESDWMGIVTPGGGAGKGFVVMPDRGDNVLVIFPNEDPAQGLVLGGLYGTHGPPEAGGIKGGSVQRYALLTPGGQLVRLDDDQDSIHLENRDGSYVELTPQRVRVHAAADLTLEAPGKSVHIRGHTIRFEEA